MHNSVLKSLNKGEFYAVKNFIFTTCVCNFYKPCYHVIESDF